MKKQHEIEEVANRLFLEVSHDSEKIYEGLFGGGNGPGTKQMRQKDFVDLWRRNWEDPPRPEWRADELDRFAPRDPKTGVRPEMGLKAFNALLKEAFPNGRMADQPKPPPQSPTFAPPQDGGPTFPPPDMSNGIPPPQEATMNSSGPTFPPPPF